SIGVTTNPPGRRRSSRSNAAQTRSSSGRSAWQDTTAYRSPPATMRIFAAKDPRALAVVALAAAVPRLVVLGVGRGKSLTAYAEKSDRFAQTFVTSGTFGFIPDHPSAYTQPLYGFFLVPLYWVFGRSWPVVGIAQIALATCTALLVYGIARRVAPRFALL